MSPGDDDVSPQTGIDHTMVTPAGTTSTTRVTGGETLGNTGNTS